MLACPDYFCNPLLTNLKQRFYLAERNIYQFVLISRSCSFISQAILLFETFCGQATGLRQQLQSFAGVCCQGFVTLVEREVRLAQDNNVYLTIPATGITFVIMLTTLNTANAVAHGHVLVLSRGPVQAGCHRLPLKKWQFELSAALFILFLLYHPIKLSKVNRNVVKKKTSSSLQDYMCLMKELQRKRSVGESVRGQVFFSYFFSSC